jgi:hypothetical protein
MTMMKSVLKLQNALTLELDRRGWRIASVITDEDEQPWWEAEVWRLESKWPATTHSVVLTFYEFCEEGCESALLMSRERFEGRPWDYKGCRIERRLDWRPQLGPFLDALDQMRNSGPEAAIIPEDAP